MVAFRALSGAHVLFRGGVRRPGHVQARAILCDGERERERERGHERRRHGRKERNNTTERRHRETCETGQRDGGDGAARHKREERSTRDHRWRAGSRRGRDEGASMHPTTYTKITHAHVRIPTRGHHPSTNNNKRCNNEERSTWKLTQTQRNEVKEEVARM